MTQDLSPECIHNGIYFLVYTQGYTNNHRAWTGDTRSLITEYEK